MKPNNEQADEFEKDKLVVDNEREENNIYRVDENNDPKKDKQWQDLKSYIIGGVCLCSITLISILVASFLALKRYRSREKLPDSKAQDPISPMNSSK